jgi:hypothetical protein
MSNKVNRIMKYNEIEAKARKHLESSLGMLWDRYSEDDKSKLITGYIFGFNEAYYDAAMRESEERLRRFKEKMKQYESA